ncbi:hypothetical protein EYC84_011952 [Monilinia fructicola]|uniref:Uncharacterized protein n=1 Tax=Monilinia fructicola TaxID=38448 RepID=A0A5M9J7T9_MONFR|nr:hypothetical protein EYC84_011952 [Monilinia fructicola]
MRQQIINNFTAETTDSVWLQRLQRLRPRQDSFLRSSLLPELELAGTKTLAHDQTNAIKFQRSPCRPAQTESALASGFPSSAPVSPQTSLLTGQATRFPWGHPGGHLECGESVKNALFEKASRRLAWSSGKKICSCSWQRVV